MDRVRIKETAKSLLKKNHWLCVGVALIVTLLGGATTGFTTNFNLNFENTQTHTEPNTDFSIIEDIIQNDISPIFIITFILIFILGMIGGFAINAFVGSQVKVGSCRFFLKYRKNQPTEIGELFKSYTDRTFINVAKTSIIKNLSILLWSMLCIVPGIIKTYEYAAVDYILSVNPTMDYKRAFDLSKKIMYGHKLELFELYISFFGWHLLSIFTCGLLSILYILPYQMIAEAEFFAYVREHAILNGVISYNDIPDYEAFNPQPPAYQGFAPSPLYQPPVNANYNSAPVQPTFTPVQPVSTPKQTPDEPMVITTESPVVEAKSEKPTETTPPATNTENVISEDAPVNEIPEEPVE